MSEEPLVFEGRVLVRKKVCRSCGEIKPRVDFNRQNRASDGLQSKCRDCERERMLRLRYGITLLEYEGMARKQKYRCRICRFKPDGVLDVDHCHETGEIRGLLCNRCNRGLQVFRDDPELLRRGSRYLEGSL